MKRLLPLALVLLTPVAARASTIQPAARHATQPASMTRLLTAMRHPDRAGLAHAVRHLSSLHSPPLRMSPQMQGSTSSSGKGVSPRITSKAPANTNAASLALPQDVIDAGNGTQGLVGSGQGPFTRLHKSWSGYQSGVAASLNFEPTMDLYYQGSVFSSSNAARNYMAESYSHLTTGNPVPPQDCKEIVDYACKIVGYVTTDDLVAVYSVAQIGSCTIETGYQGDPDLVKQNLDDVSQLTADTFTYGIAAAQDACAGSSSPNPQPTQRPATPRPTTAPPAPRPTSVRPPAAVPTKTPTSGTGTVGSATVIFKARGAGSDVTQIFSTPSTWRLDWWYNCSSTGKNGQYSLIAKGSKGSLHPKVSRRGWEEHGSLLFRHAGQTFLTVTTGCHWHLRVYGQR